MSESIRNKIRQQIKPMPKARLFPTGWNRELTFEQIAEDVTPRVVWKFKRYGVLCTFQNELAILRAWTENDVSDEEWAFIAPYLTLMSEDTPQREHSLREGFKCKAFCL